MPPLFLGFALFFAAVTLFGVGVRWRQLGYVRRHRDTVPAGFDLGLAEHRRAADYETARLRLGMAAAAYSFVLLLAWIGFGYDALFPLAAERVPAGPGRSVAFVLVVWLLSQLLALPLALLGTFGVERRFGFNRTGVGTFVLDRVKGTALALAIGTPLLFGLFWLMRQPGLWWLWAWAGLLLLMLAATEAFPRFIAPLFNRFTPLEGPLRARIEGLLRRCGFDSAGLFVMDASKRSAHGNAYFTGFGRSKRIVLFDTLVANNSEAELEAVLAHELGHYKLRHILVGLAETAAVTFVGFFAIGWLCRQPWLLPGFGITHVDDGIAILICLAVVQMAGPFLGVAQNWLSWRHEYQADDFARRMVGAAPMESALIKLSKDNASTLTTDPLYAIVNLSHPPVPLRVARLRAAA